MNRNQISPDPVKNLSAGVMFTVDGNGNITPTEQQGQQKVLPKGTIVTQAAASGTSFSGRVCARQNNACRCSTLVDGVPGNGHMAIGAGYTVKQSVPLKSTFKLQAVTASGPVANASNGEIIIGTT